MGCISMAGILPGCAVLGKLTVMCFEGKGRGNLKSHT